MQLRFRNSYGPRIWVAVMFRESGACTGDYGGWRTRGWWAVDYGGTVHVLNTNNRYAYFYAEAANGAVWTGPYGPICVKSAAFGSCSGLCWTGADGVWMREVYIPSGSHTVNLTP